MICAGPGLVFVVYPAAIARMPGSPVWAALFFVFLFTVGVDSQVRNSVVCTHITDHSWCWNVLHIYGLKNAHICIWHSWCHCHWLFLAPVNPEWFYLSGTIFLGSPGQRAVKWVLLL